MTESAIRWKDVQRHFPPEEVARLRREFMEAHRAGASKAELTEKYHMSEKTYYNTLHRYEDALELEDYVDRPKAPKGPHRKLSDRDIEILVELARREMEGFPTPRAAS